MIFRLSNLANSEQMRWLLLLATGSPICVAAEQSDTATILTMIAEIAGGLVGISVIGGLVYLAFYFRKKYFKLIKLIKKTKADDAEAAVHYENVETTQDGWEINRDQVTINNSVILGKGAFGMVHIGQIDTSGLLQNPTRSTIQISELDLSEGKVAVKLLLETADEPDKMEFLREIEIMKGIGFHERLVNLVACVSKTTPYLLITEYCTNGDLLRSLRERRQYMLSLPRNVDYRTVDLSLVITQDQQLQYAVHVACGLEYLSSQGFIHRDIAARNILIDAKNRCKIGDFGMCRKVQEDHPLYHARGGRFPIKWMAPESLKRYETSYASDVWSFGILLFEIISLGGSPYPDWEPGEVLSRLDAGERMARPDNCPDAIFEIMTECWKNNPLLRPTISDLRLRLEKELDKTPSEHYPQLDARKDY